MHYNIRRRLDKTIVGGFLEAKDVTEAIKKIEARWKTENFKAFADFLEIKHGIDLLYTYEDRPSHEQPPPKSSSTPSTSLALVPKPDEPKVVSEVTSPAVLETIVFDRWSTPHKVSTLDV
jgi:hypothetical protein